MHKKNVKNETAKDFKSSIKKLIKYSKSYLPFIIIGLISAAVASVLSIVGPDKLKEITDVITAGIITGIDLDKIKNIGLVLVTYYSLSFIFNYIEGFVMAHVTSKFSRELRSNVAKNKQATFIIFRPYDCR